MTASLGAGLGLSLGMGVGTSVGMDADNLANIQTYFQVPCIFCLCNHP